MSDHTGIEWTDATWNPVTGCTKVSPGWDCGRGTCGARSWSRMLFGQLSRLTLVTDDCHR